MQCSRTALAQVGPCLEASHRTPILASQNQSCSTLRQTGCCCETPWSTTTADKSLRQTPGTGKWPQRRSQVGHLSLALIPTVRPSLRETSKEAKPKLVHRKPRRILTINGDGNRNSKASCIHSAKCDLERAENELCRIVRNWHKQGLTWQVGLILHL
jgi:hypothetical protein